MIQLLFTGRKYTETNPTNVSYQLGIADTTSTSVNTHQMVVKGNTINAKPENFSEQNDEVRYLNKRLTQLCIVHVTVLYGHGVQVQTEK